MVNYPSAWQKDFDLGKKNTMAAPCVAAFYVEVHSEAELVEHLQCAKALDVPVFVLSGGSNILCPPLIDGLVISPLIYGVDALVNGDDVLVTVSSGQNWHSFVESCLHNGWHGLENLALIPGLCGAAPIQNIGAYGVELSDVLVNVRFYHCEQECFTELNRAQCHFGYRDSVFKQALQGKAVITAMTLKLTIKPVVCCEYGPLKALFEHQAASPQALFDAVCELRRSKLPDPQDIPNAGSFFKNPIITSAQFLALKSSCPAVPSFPAGAGYVKVPAAWLIDQAGLKGQDVGALKVHSQQALVLTNPNGASLSAILAASNVIAREVEARFAISLEREPQIFGQIAN